MYMKLYIPTNIFLLVILCSFGSTTACRLGTGTAAHGGSSGALLPAQQTNCNVINSYNGSDGY